jgi:hypothetical protein
MCERIVSLGRLTRSQSGAAFGCYLIALGVLPFRWLSPIGSLYEHADWTDILVALAAGVDSRSWHTSDAD